MSSNNVLWSPRGSRELAYGPQGKGEQGLTGKTLGLPPLLQPED